MSKKNNDFDDFDIEGLDGIDDFDADFDIDFPEPGSRKPIDSLKTGVKEGFKKSILDRANIKRLVAVTLGKGYAQGIDTYDILKQEGAEVFNKNKSEAKGLLRQGISIATMAHPSVEKNVPKWLSDSIKDDSYSSERDEENEPDSELNANISSIDKLLKFNRRLEKEKFAREKLRSVKSAQILDLKLKSSGAIASGIQRLVAYQDKVTISYQRKSLEQNYRMIDLMSKSLAASTKYYEMSSEMMASIVTNTGLPDYVKMNGPEFIKQNIRNRLVESTVGTLAKGLAPIKDRANDMIGSFMSQIGMFTDQLEENDAIDPASMLGSMLGDKVGSMMGGLVNPLLERAGNKVSPYLQKIPGLKKGDNLLKQFGSNPALFLNTLLTNGVGSEFLDPILSELASTPNAGDSIKTGLEELEDGIGFDKRTHRTVNEIIPAYLASMDRSLFKLSTGEDRGEMKWSHFDGAMVTSDQSFKQFVKLGLKDGKVNDARYAVDQVMQSMGALELSGPSKNVLRRALLDKMHAGVLFDPRKYSSPKDWGKVDPVIANELSSFMRDTFGIEIDKDNKRKYSDDQGAQDNLERFTDQYVRNQGDIKNHEGRFATLLSVVGKEEARRRGYIYNDARGEEQINHEKLKDLMLEADVTYSFEKEMLERKKKQDEQDAKKAAMAKGLSGAKDTAVGKAKGWWNKVTGRGNQKVRVVDDVTGEVTEIDVTYDQLQAAIALDEERSADITDGATIPKKSFLGGIFNRGDDKKEPGFFKRHFGSKVTNASTRLEELQTYLKTRTLEEIMGDVKTTYDETFTKEKQEELKKFIENDPMGKRFLNGMKRLNKYKPKSTIAKLKSMFSSSDPVDGSGPSTAMRSDITGFASDPRTEVPPTQLEDTGTHERLDILNESTLASQAILTELLEITMTLPHAIGGIGQAGMEDPVVRNRQGRLRQLSRWMGQRKDRIMGYFGKKTQKPRSFLGAVGTIAGTIASTSWGGISLLGRGLRGTMGLSVKAGALATKAGWEAAKFAIPGAFNLAKKTAGLALDAGIGLGKLGLGATMGTLGMAGKAIKGTSKLAFDKRGFLGEGDVYRVDNPERILLKRSDLISGRFIDVNTGKPITKFKDITGAVEDDKGNQVITDDDYNLGIKSKGESIVGYSVRTAGKAAGLAASLTGKVLSPIFKPYIWVYNKILGKNPLENTDAWVRGEDKPRIYARLLKDGHYSRGSGYVIYSLDEIDGALYDGEQNEVITAGEFNERMLLVDRAGKPLYKLGSGLLGNSRLASKARNLVRPVTKIVKGAFGLAKGIITAPFKLLGRMKRAIFGKSTEEEIQGIHTEILGEQLSIQYGIYNLLRKSNLTKEDDDDGTSNSWKDIITRRKKAREATLTDVVNKLDEMNDDSNQRLDALADAVDPKKSLWDKAKGLAGGLGDRALDMAKGAMGWVSGKLAATKAGAAVKSAWGFLKANGIRSALWAGAKAVGGATLGLVGVTGAVIAGALVVVGVGGYLLYKGYQTRQAKKSLLTYLRFVQYGIDPREQKEVDAIIKLETLLEKRQTITADPENPDKKSVRVNTSDLPLADLMQIFGISEDEMNPPEGGKLDPKIKTRMEKIVKWFRFRFLLPYVASLNGSQLVKGDTKLGNLDETVKGTKGIEYIKEVKKLIARATANSEFKTPNKLWDSRKDSPFEDGWMFDAKLWADADDVNEAYDRAEAAFSKEDSVTDLTVASIGPMDKRKEASINAMKADTELNVSTNGSTDMMEVGKDIVKIGHGRNLRNANGYIAGDKKSMANNLKSIDVSMAVRYLTYGLTKFVMTKVEQLWLLEKYHIDKQPHGATSYHEVIDGIDRAFLIFRAKTPEAKGRIVKWYRLRFLPFFKNYIGSMMENNVTDLMNGSKTFSKKKLRVILQWMIGYTDEEGNDPWKITESPWDESCNTDPTVTEPFMSALEKEMGDEVVKVEGAPKATAEVTQKLNKETAKLMPGSLNPKNQLTGSELLMNRSSVEAETAPKPNSFFNSMKSMFGLGKPPEEPVYTTTPDGGKNYKPAKSPGREKAISVFLEAMKELGITDPNEMSMILAQVSEETGDFTRMEENLKYTTVKRMQEVWPARFLHNPALAQRLINGGPEAIANNIYGNRMGNKEPGDGWKYRGRGYIQLTGRDNYAAASKRLGIDLLSNPDLILTDPKIAAKTTLDWWLHRGGNLRGKAAAGDLVGVTKLVNGGTTNLSGRAAKLNYFKANLDEFVEKAKGFELIENVSGDVPPTSPITSAPPNTVNPVAEANVAAGTGGVTTEGNVKERVSVLQKEIEQEKEVIAEIAQSSTAPTVAPTVDPLVTAAKRTTTVSPATVARQEVEQDKQQAMADNSNSVLDQQLIHLSSMDGTLKDILSNIIHFSNQQSKQTRPLAPTRSSPSSQRKTGLN